MLWDKPLYSLKGQIPQPIPNLINVFDEKIVDKIKILFSCKNRVESRFLALCKSKKTLRICISTNLQGQFLCLDNYSVGWAFCPLTGYFTLPVDKNVTGQLQISFLRAKILSFYIQMKSPFHPEIHAIYLLKTRAFLHLIPYFAPKHQKKTLRTSDHSKVLRVFLF